jgi:hypothetical protein
MHICAQIVARVPPVELRGVIEDCSVSQNIRSKALLHTGATMTVPHYINEDRSEMRGIKPGWYAMDDAGKLKSGPFSSHEECLNRSTQPTHEPRPSQFASTT